jgi:uncharacterized protein with FMN-binding domain
MHGPLSVEVGLSTNAITAVKVTANVETPGVSTTSRAIMAAVADALSKVK